MLHSTKPSIADLKRLQRSRSKVCDTNSVPLVVDQILPSQVQSKQDPSTKEAETAFNALSHQLNPFGTGLNEPKKRVYDSSLPLEDPFLNNFQRYQRLRRQESRTDPLQNDKENIDPSLLDKENNRIDNLATELLTKPEVYSSDNGDHRLNQLWNRLSKRPLRKSLSVIQDLSSETKSIQEKTNAIHNRGSNIETGRFIDWSLKSRIQLHSKSKDLKTLFEPEDVKERSCQAQIEFASNIALDQTRYPELSLLYHWVYPPPNIVTPSNITQPRVIQFHHPLHDLNLSNVRLAKAAIQTQSTKHGPTQTDQALFCWQDAAKSLFLAFETGYCEYFYMIRADINVIFLKKHGQLQVRIRILDDHRLIKELESTSFWEKRHIVDDSLVYNSTNQEVFLEPDSEQMDILEEMRVFEQLSPGSTRIHRASNLYTQQKSTFYDNIMQSHSSICFSGLLVSQVFEWIYNLVSYTTPLSTTLLPVLISPTIFHQASLYRACISFPKPLRRLVPSNESTQSTSIIKYTEDTVHRMVLSGIILPKSLQMLLKYTFKYSGPFDLELDSEPHSIGFTDIMDHSDLLPGHHTVKISVKESGNLDLTTHPL
jgi:hypothetical protein